MGAGGLSGKRLGRMHTVLTGHVERGSAPGVVALVSRRGKVHVEAFGHTTTEGGTPIRRDTIFRISSMTKPIIAAATMILVEECVLRLDEPVDRLLPELANRTVLTSIDAPLTDTVPAQRPITVRDLLTFRLGLGQIMAAPNSYPIQQAISELGLIGFGPPHSAQDLAPDEWLRRLGTLPLMHQPGEDWRYNTGADVLGVLIARASGQPLETFLRERIFAPLGMVDTGFSVPAADLDRFTPVYRTDPATGERGLVDGVGDSAWRAHPAFPSGGGGLVSTIDDYHAFGRMMLDEGEFGNERILSRLSVDVMTTDQLTPAQKANSALAPGFWDDHGWGFGLAVVTARTGPSTVPGQFGWDGGFGSCWRSDPREDMVTVLLSNEAWSSARIPDLCLDFWTSAYQAIND